MAAPTLWRHPNFLKLWIGQSVSQFGNQFTGLALQFLALKTLLASPSQIGLLGAMGTDGRTFFFSSGRMARNRTPEAVPAASERRSVRAEIREGLHVVFRDRRLWSIAGCTGTANLFSGALFALFTLYAVRVLGLDEVGIGTIGGIGGIGGILGAVTANRLANRIGIGRAIVVGILAGSLSSFGVVLATPQFAFVFLTAMVFVGALGTLWYNINQVSLRQSLVPVRIQGRLNATMRFLVWGTLPIGSLLGGALGEIIGVYPAIVLAAVGGLLAIPWVFFSPVRHLMTIPPPAAD